MFEDVFKEAERIKNEVKEVVAAMEEDSKKIKAKILEDIKNLEGDTSVLMAEFNKKAAVIEEEFRAKAAAILEANFKKIDDIAGKKAQDFYDKAKSSIEKIHQELAQKVKDSSLSDFQQELTKMFNSHKEQLISSVTIKSILKNIFNFGKK